MNTQPFDLTLVPQGDRLAFALTGTDYRAPVTDPEFEATRPYWEQTLPSESPRVYRGEHLAARLLDERGADALTALDPAELAALVRKSAAAAYDEGHQRGVHDEDATAILTTLLRLHSGAGLLRFPPAVRAAAQLFWAYGADEDRRASWTRRALSLARARETFGLTPAVDALQEEWAAVIAGEAPSAVAAYLFEELTSGPAGFVTSAAARTFLDKFRRTTGTSAYDEDLAALGDDLPARRQLVEGWLGSYAAASGTPIGAGTSRRPSPWSSARSRCSTGTTARPRSPRGWTACWAPTRASTGAP